MECLRSSSGEPGTSNEGGLLFDTFEDTVIRLLRHRYVVPRIKLGSTAFLRVQVIGVSRPRVVRTPIREANNCHSFSVDRTIKSLVDKSVHQVDQSAHFLRDLLIRLLDARL